MLLANSWVFSQSDPQYNQYFFNPVLVNPSYAGSRGMLSVVAVHRSQWVGFEGAPASQSFAIHTPSRNKKMGLGFQAMHEEIGPKSTVSAAGIYNYKLRMGRGRLGLGVRAGIYNYTFDWSEISYRESGGYALNDGRETYLVPSFDFGLFYSDKFNYAGLELSHLNAGKLGLEAPNVNLSSVSRQQRQIIGVAGRAMKINRDLVFKPSLLFRFAENQPFFLDLNASILMRDKLWLGVSYRRGYGAVAIVEYNLNRSFRIGYSYDIAVTSLSRQNYGSHEIFLGYDINLFRSRIVSPRYF